MKHDQGENLDAAESLRQAIELAGRGAPRGAATSALNWARMNYFHSRHWAEQGDHEQEKKFLDEAIRHDLDGNRRAHCSLSPAGGRRRIPPGNDRADREDRRRDGEQIRTSPRNRASATSSPG